MDKLVDGLVFPEGPLWHDGSLLFVEVYAHRLSRWDGRARTTLWHDPGCGACAVGRAPDGTLLVPCFDGGFLARLTPDGRLLGRRHHGDDGHPLTGANDLVLDGHGGAYVTASGRWDVAAPPEGAVFHLAPDGRLRRVAAGLAFTNGIALIDGGRTLVVAETLARRLTRFTVARDGSLAEPRPFCRLDDFGPRPPDADPYAGPDGLELDPFGRLWVCEYGAGRVHVVDGRGRLLRTHTVPAIGVTNVAFDPDGNAYITATEDPWHDPYPGAIWRVPAA
ncbi:MAG: SMP-30/gluconolactonase/LRE family protein [Alphaproteobacteria bacterium]